MAVLASSTIVADSSHRTAMAEVRLISVSTQNFNRMQMTISVSQNGLFISRVYKFIGTFRNNLTRKHFLVFNSKGYR